MEGVYKWWQGSIQLGKGTHVAYMLGQAIWEEKKTLVTGPWLLVHFCLAIGLYLVIIVTQWKSNKSLTTSYRLSIGLYLPIFLNPINAAVLHILFINLIPIKPYLVNNVTSGASNWMVWPTLFILMLLFSKTIEQFLIDHILQRKNNTDDYNKV